MPLLELIKLIDLDQFMFYQDHCICCLCCNINGPPDHLSPDHGVVTVQASGIHGDPCPLLSNIVQPHYYPNLLVSITCIAIYVAS